jgi:hypothetical protein
LAITITKRTPTGFPLVRSTSNWSSNIMYRSTSRCLAKRSGYSTLECPSNAQIAIEQDTINANAKNSAQIGLDTSRGFSKQDSTTKNCSVAGSMSSRTRSGPIEDLTTKIEEAARPTTPRSADTMVPGDFMMVARRKTKKGVDPLINTTEAATTRTQGVDPLVDPTIEAMIEGVDLLNRVNTGTRAIGVDPQARYDPRRTTPITVEGVDPLNQRPPKTNEPTQLPQETISRGNLQTTTSGLKSTRKAIEMTKGTAVTMKARQGVDQGMMTSHQLDVDHTHLPQRVVQTLQGGAEDTNLIISWNCSHGLTQKIDFVRFLIDKYNPLAMFISESDLTANDEINANFFYVVLL